MKRVGFVGWRGMVGSVLMERMVAENDFAHIAEPVFFTTSQAGQLGPDVGQGRRPLNDASDIEALCETKRLALVQHLEDGEHLAIALDEFGQLPQSRGTLGRWSGGPDRLGAIRRVDSRVDICRPSGADGGEYPPGGRVRHLKPLTVDPVGPRAPNEHRSRDSDEVSKTDAVRFAQGQLVKQEGLLHLDRA